MISGLVNASFSLSEWQAVKMIFFAPCRKESVFQMQAHLDMGNNYIYNVKTLVNNDQGAKKSYVDQHIAKSGNTMSGDLNMGSNQISGLFQIPLTLFQLPPNTTDTNMQKICFESYRKYNL